MAEALFKALVTVLLLESLFGGAATLQASPDDAEPWQAARKLYYEAVEGNRAAAERATELFDRLRSAHPDEPRFLVYRGSLLLLESARALAPWRKGKLAKEGLLMMDRAVATAPDDLEVRFVRAASTMRLPGFFKRGDESERDIAYLASRVRDAHRSGKLDARLATAALLYHAGNREKKGDSTGANDACKTVLSIASDTPAAAACKERLGRVTR